jgi:hypothetical protein
MMLPFAIVAIVTQAHGYISSTALIITSVFYVVGLYYSFSARCPRSQDSLVVALGRFRYTALDTDMVHLLSELRSFVRHRA